MEDARTREPLADLPALLALLVDRTPTPGLAKSEMSAAPIPVGLPDFSDVMRTPLSPMLPSAELNRMHALQKNWMIRFYS